MTSQLLIHCGFLAISMKIMISLWTFQCLLKSLASFSDFFLFCIQLLLYLIDYCLFSTQNAPLLVRGLPQVTFYFPGTCWIQIKWRFVLLRSKKFNPSTRHVSRNSTCEVHRRFGVQKKTTFAAKKRILKSSYEVTISFKYYFWEKYVYVESLYL